jgi:hypothetical protein
MHVYIHHGRLDPTTAGTDEEGVEHESWGFEGPILSHCTGFHITYGDMSSLVFKDATSYEHAKARTGWPEGCAEYSLEPKYEGECLKVWNESRHRYEFFGDWGLI